MEKSGVKNNFEQLSEREREGKPYLEGYEKKFVIFLDDDGSQKEKVAWIRAENSGWWIKLDPLSKPFWISSVRVLKIKPTSDDKLEKKEGVNNGRRE